GGTLPGGAAGAAASSLGGALGALPGAGAGAGAPPSAVPPSAVGQGAQGTLHRAFNYADIAAHLVAPPTDREPQACREACMA
ncbi:unnamed protein product, partial [Prorocentrum cordatum]